MKFVTLKEYYNDKINLIDVCKSNLLKKYNKKIEAITEKKRKLAEQKDIRKKINAKMNPDWESAQNVSPCNDIITQNIKAVNNGGELTAPLHYLNQSCEFKKVYERLNGPIASDKHEFANIEEKREMNRMKAKASKLLNPQKFKERAKMDSKKRRENRKSKGLCIFCGCKVDRVGMFNCSKCLKRSRNYQRKWKTWKKQ